jgi:hypothetical protein
MTLKIQRDHSRFRDIVRGRIRKGLKDYILHGEMIGKQLVVACARAFRPLRKPGADTVRQMPGFCVRNPAMDAA